MYMFSNNITVICEVRNINLCNGILLPILAFANGTTALNSDLDSWLDQSQLSEHVPANVSWIAKRRILTERLSKLEILWQIWSMYTGPPVVLDMTSCFS